ncbi:uncharacterized protein SPAPADRAFT_65786 [Spathaspora passalidarum NRRL Y-27907]|uniref:Uncharacterized protein n=1 Tax=Spathaspora passalidarum (strain NRRL Y-27907 / 11-Y1) TaxID=619300 RepID=G3AM37_SPAPN|nr:uncharacterized protein SPAPADRAFT_65786 [Spathaspora passalidarum NRRL Y-27907]EGW32742.1 hypothetical protein SPAPADRAFT_65786 [Spathaspora passalidarum NRRL Y-27907]
MSSLTTSIDNLMTEASDVFSKNSPAKILIDAANSEQRLQSIPDKHNESNEQESNVAHPDNSIDKSNPVSVETDDGGYDNEDEQENRSDTDSHFHRTVLQSHVIINRPQSNHSLLAEFAVGSSAATNENVDPESLFGFPDSAIFRKNQTSGNAFKVQDLNGEPIELETATGSEVKVEGLDSALANMSVSSIIKDDFNSPVKEVLDEVAVTETADQSVITSSTVEPPLESSTPKQNPVVEALRVEPKMKEFKLISPSKNFIENTAIVANSKLDEYSWISNDYNNLFGNKSFTREINLSKLLRFEEKLPNLLDENDIYISTRILNPGKILSGFFKDGNKRNVYIDLILNNNGFTIFSQILKYFSEHEKEANSKIIDILVRISATTVEQLRYFVEKFSESKVYQKVKLLGLFSGLHVYSDNNFPIEVSDEKLKLPAKLEKLCLSAGLNVTDFVQLPYSIKHIGLYNVPSLNVSKFNNKRLDCVHISSGDPIEFIGRQDNFPKSFLDLKDLKLDSSIVVNPQFDKFSHLVNLSIRNLDFATTRQLTFPSCLKKLEFIDCCISSHISSFPDSLKTLIVKGGKWNKKRNCNLTRVQKLTVVKADVKDLHEKLVSARSLLYLEIVDVEVDKLELPSGLKNLKLLSVNLSLFDVRNFPNGLETVVLDDNKISWTDHLVKLKQVKSLKITNNGIYGRVSLSECSKLEDVAVYDNDGLLAIKLPNSVKSLNVANTKVHEICGDNLTKLNVNGCTKIDWESFNIPASVTHLTAQGCGLTRFEYGIRNDGLKVLNIANNNIEQLDLHKFNSIQDLDLSSNQLKRLVKLPLSLKSINAGNNRISEVDVAMLETLEWLELSNNHITSLTRVHVPICLRTLLLNNNQFGRFAQHEFDIPSKLCHLELNGCNLSEFVQVLPSSLLSFCASNNKLNRLRFRFVFASVSNLKYVDLHSNIFDSFDFSLFKGIEIAELNLSDNLFAEAPNIPDNILTALI